MRLCNSHFHQMVSVSLPELEPRQLVSSRPGLQHSDQVSLGHTLGLQRTLQRNLHSRAARYGFVHNIAW